MAFDFELLSLVIRFPLTSHDTVAFAPSLTLGQGVTLAIVRATIIVQSSVTLDDCVVTSVTSCDLGTFLPLTQVSESQGLIWLAGVDLVKHRLKVLLVLHRLDFVHAANNLARLDS